MRLFSVVFVLVLATSALAAEPGPFSFVIPWNDVSRNITNVSDLNPAPLEEKHRITVKGGHFVDQTGRRVRFLGTNFVAGTCFPKTPEDARQIAAHLHRLGFNCVRLHHMDAAWSQPNLFGDKGGWGDGTLDPKSLAMLDELLWQFRQHGIYVDLNLHVAWGVSKADGLPEFRKLNAQGKVVAYFEPKLIERQKKFARDLLNHVSAKSNQRLADDPVLAVIELDNEDSLVGSAWEIPELPDHYQAILRRGFNDYLKAKYATTPKLLAAWNSDVNAGGVNLLANGRFEKDAGRDAGRDAGGWDLEQHEAARGRIAVEDRRADVSGEPPGRMLAVKDLKPDATLWHLQLSYGGMDLKDGQTYTLSFAARAPRKRSMRVMAGQANKPWANIGLESGVSLDAEWRRYAYSFVAENTQEKNSRIAFQIGNDAGAFYLADVSVRAGQPPIELPAGQSIERGTIDLPALSTSAAGLDAVAYLMDVEKRYTDAMRDVIRNDARCGAPITCSQADYGRLAGTLRESRMDWVDMHNYWQHPQFPNRPWDENDYRIGNTPLVRQPDGGTLAEIARFRVAAKPFTVSEYDHPAPSEWAAEMMPMLAATAAVQDWDGVFLFAYDHSNQEWDRRHINGFFDQASHPGKKAFVPAAARLFLGGAIPPAPRETMRIPIRQVPALALGKGVEFVKPGGDITDALCQSSWAVEFTDDPRLAKPQPQPRQGGGDQLLRWQTADPARAVFALKGGSAAVLVGFPGDAEQDLGDARVRLRPDSPRGFVSLMMTPMDGRPLAESRSILLVAVDKVENKGLAWNEQRTFARNSWTGGPTLASGVAANISLRSDQPLSAWVLDGAGNRQAKLPITRDGNKLLIEIGPQYKSIWYELAVEERR